MISLDVLRNIVDGMINEDTFPLGYRCHEFARVLAPKLKDLGCDVEVRDGFVEYDVHFLLVSFYLPILEHLSLSQDEKKQMLEEAMYNENRTIHVLHSWCEIVDAGCTVVIDLHPTLKVNSHTVLSWPLIVEEKSKLSHRYHISGRTFGRWLVIRTRRLPYVTRLRLRSAL